MRYYCSLGCLLILLLSACGSARTVCFTFDDLPVAANGQEDTTFYVATFTAIVQQLEANHIPAIGFINEKNLYQNDSLLMYRLKLLQMWSDKGLQLGNHSFSHLSYHQYPLAIYGADILKGEKLTGHLMTARNATKYFRHPFLHIGDSKAKADSLNEFLAMHHYKVAPVTIDNDDYLFSAAYQKALSINDSSMATKVKHDYLQYMEQKLVYFEAQSIKLYQRNIRHILLLHTNILNAHSLTELAAIYKKRGYKPVSLDQALKDKVYRSEISVYKNWGISWLDRWALSQKVPKDFFVNEPETPQYLTDYINKAQ